MQPAESQHLDSVTQTTSGLRWKSQAKLSNLEHPLEMRWRGTQCKYSSRGEKGGPSGLLQLIIFAYLNGCSPHTEELRRNDSPSVSSIAVTIDSSQKTFCRGKQKVLVTWAPTLFSPKNAEQGKKSLRASDWRTRASPTHTVLIQAQKNALKTTRLEQANPRKPQKTADKNAEILNEVQ